MESLLGAIAHRGPDDAGIIRFDEVGSVPAAVFGHRRLSVIDLSTNGHQPMSNSDGSRWIVFNGEIYNFSKIRQQLVLAGHKFRSSTDTEVILHGHEEWGEDAIQHLNGMFAYAIFDRTNGELRLVRDRLGIKPLYYTRTPGKFAFASEMKALLRIPGVPSKIDLEALDLYLAMGYVPGPRTIFSGIEKLQPGHTLVLRDGKVSIQNYWSLPSPQPVNSSAAEQAEEFRDLLTEAVSDQMVSDVPLGSFLSGGLDSSVVTALMARKLGSQRRVQTFCVGYDLQESRHDESDYAALVSEHVGTEHHKIICSDRYAVESLKKLVWHMDEPVAEDLLPPYAKLSEYARKHVTVVLSGEGADEFLYGYRYYCIEKTRQRLGRIPRPLRKLGRAALEGMACHDNLRVRALCCGLEDDEFSSYIRWSTLYTEKERRGMYGDAIRPQMGSHDPADAFRSVLADVKAKETDFAPAMDARYRMVDYILSRADKLSMAVGLEVRVPFLDHRIVEYLARVPVMNKIHGFEGKQLLRTIASSLLPDEIVHRRKKPFGAPVAEWIDQLSRLYLHNSRLVSDGLIRKDYLSGLISQGMASHGAHTRIWALIILELWYRVYIYRDSEVMERADN